MGERIKYTDYEQMYPQVVIIRKEGYFYMTRGESAVVMHAFFKYKGWKSSAGVVSIGFPIPSLETVIDTLSNKMISFMVIDKGEIVAGENFDENNQFMKYVSTDISDIQFAEKKQKNKKSELSISDDEKRLCGISVKYLERMLEGRNPVNNMELESESILLDENVRKCFSFLVNILKRVNLETTSAEDNNQQKQQEKRDHLKLNNNAMDVIDHIVDVKGVTVTQLLTLINNNKTDIFCETNVKITVARVSNWLLAEGYLISIANNEGIKHREATEKGNAIGITNVEVPNGELASYIQYRFNADAQRFVINHIPDMFE